MINTVINCLVCGSKIVEKNSENSCSNCNASYCQNCMNLIGLQCWGCGSDDFMNIENERKIEFEFSGPQDQENATTLRKEALDGYAKAMMDLSPTFLNAALKMTYERLVETGYQVEQGIMLKMKRGKMQVDLYGKGKKDLIVLFAQNAGEARTNILLFSQLQKEKKLIKYLYIIREDLPTDLLETAFLQRIRIVHSPERIR